MSARRRGRWACTAPGVWSLDHTALRLERDSEHGWCLWGHIDGVYPAGLACGWYLDDAMAHVEAWTESPVA